MGLNAARAQAVDLQAKIGNAAGGPTWEDIVDFTDRHVLVTGGTGVLGTAVVRALLASGAICHLPCRSGSDAAGFAHRDHPRVSVVPTPDLADDAAIGDLFAGLPGIWASIHLVGAFAAGAIGETGSADLRRMIDANFISCFLCCRAAVAAMRSGTPGGRIVNVAARPGIEWRAGADMTAYAASKAAVAALTVALAEEVAGHGILVNAVAPSILDTAANRRDMPKADFGSWPKAEQVASTILFLASPANTVTRGAIVPVYGRA
jgi:NAD(P)-dependent dehydrogenase (short-subunit alcohol dehydrogenase family)